MMVLSSMSNGQVKRLVQLQKKTRARKGEDVFLVEGPKMCMETPAEDLLQAYVSAGYWEQNGDRWPAGLPEPVLLSDAVFAAVSDTKSPQGILCVVRQRHYQKEELLGRKPLLLVLERLQDPGNLGTIFRSAEGAGVTGILMTEDCADLYAPKVVRSTMGAIYRVPFAYTADLTADLAWLQDQGIRLFAAHLKGACAYDRCDYRDGTAFVIGNESRGLQDATAAACDERVLIPMQGQVESLNAAVASSLLVYEAARQRRKY